MIPGSCEFRGAELGSDPGGFYSRHVAAESARRGRRWLQGVSHSRTAFGQPSRSTSSIRISEIEWLSIPCCGEAVRLPFRAARSLPPPAPFLTACENGKHCERASGAND